MFFSFSAVELKEYDAFKNTGVCLTTIKKELNIEKILNQRKYCPVSLKKDTVNIKQNNFKFFKAVKNIENEKLTFQNNNLLTS